MQQYYGVDIDHRNHTPHHIACLLVELPSDARVRVDENADSRWTLNDIILSGIYNSLNALIYGMSDKRKRGNPPPLAGPSWMTDKKRQLPARVMPASELMEFLKLPREVDNWQNRSATLT